MNAGKNKDDNPFAVSTMLDQETGPNSPETAVVEHTDFELFEQGIITRSGLLLPAWCLYSGSEASLKPMILKIVDTQKLRAGSFGRIVGGVAIGIAGGIVLGIVGVVLSKLTGLQAPLIVGLVVIWLLLGAFGVRWSGRRRRPEQQVCIVNGYVSQFRSRLVMLFAWLPACVWALILLSPSVMVPQTVFLGLLLLTWGFQWILGRTLLKGARLSCRPLPDGRFYVTGFSKKFLQRLTQVQPD
ncbi:MAG: hypothetical protein WCK86_10740 [Planctomycetia bacterium]